MCEHKREEKNNYRIKIPIIYSIKKYIKKLKKATSQFPFINYYKYVKTMKSIA